MHESSERHGYRNTLKVRIASGFFVLGLSVSLLFGALAIYASAKAEDELVGEALSENLKGYAHRFYSDRTEVVEPLRHTYGRVVSQSKRHSLPEDWRELGTGLYKINGTQDGRAFTYRLAVRKDAQYWFFVAEDITDATASMARVSRAILGLVVVFGVASLLVGVWSASRVMRPVSDLAKRVTTLDDASREAPLAANYPRDEVGQLANAFDEYARRVHAVVTRDREFNADVSHELRTPLAVIRSAAELLLSRPQLDTQSRAIVQRILRAEQGGSDLTAALLLLSRNERDDSPCNVETVAGHLVEMHQEHAQRKGLELVLELVEPVLIHAHPAAVSVALGNLISNAVRYTIRGSIRVVIEGRMASVIDTGPGLSKEDQSRMFERGYRGGQRGPAVGGGIGLSIVWRLCELYGWRVELTNAPGGGVVATLDFMDASPRL